MGEDKLKLIEDLLIGSGAEDFRQLQTITNVFCPFEAIGMIHQEIRHSNFLSYILDENRPHGFGAVMFEALLGLIAEQITNIDIGFSRLDLHFMDITNAIVLREWRNIDIMAVIPPKKKNGSKGIALAIELKINASESHDQLKRYYDTVRTEYDSNEWNHVFVFLTLREDDPSTENVDRWVPIGLETLIRRFEDAMRIHEFSGLSTDILKSYIAMMRREHMNNEPLKDITRRIWAKHKEALDTLYENKPDYRGEIMETLYDKHDELANSLTQATGFGLTADNSSQTILRFHVKEWGKFPQMLSGDRSWLNSGHLLAIEIMCWGKEQIRISFVIGPGEAENRQTLFQQVQELKLRIGKNTPVHTTNYKHLSAEVIMKDTQYRTALQEGTNPKVIVEQVEKRAIKFLKTNLPEYNKIVENAFK